MHLDRRNFLKQSAMLGTVSLLPTFAKAAHSAPGFKLLILATRWGFPGTIDEFCKKAKDAGYDGIEVWWPTEGKGQDDLFAALKKHGLEVGFLCGGNGPDYDKHAAQFEAAVNAATSQKIKRPLYIN